MLPTYKKASKTMTFTCERCRRDFRDKTDLTRHQNRKKPCQPANPSASIQPTLTAQPLANTSMENQQVNSQDDLPKRKEFKSHEGSMPFARYNEPPSGNLVFELYKQDQSDYLFN